MMPSKEAEERKKASPSGDDGKQKKTPSLYRPGEKRQQPPQ
jgi:hypothetical protein